MDKATDERESDHEKEHRLSHIVQARILLRKQAIEDRRTKLSDAEGRDELLEGSTIGLEKQVCSVKYGARSIGCLLSKGLRSERASLQPKIHHYRAHHAQSLDGLFPILSLDPSSLLYAILKVPLPIPSGAKDPAPPLSTPGRKTDERTIAAALGYVAMVVQILGNLGGTVGGLPYPVTCAGSRSMVRDVVSVMQGPRSYVWLF